MGVSTSTWSRWEKGQNEPCISELISLCGKFGVSLDWLVGVSHARETPSPEAAAAAPCQPCRDKDAVISALAGTVRSQQETIRTLAERDEKKTASLPDSLSACGARDGEVASA